MERSNRDFALLIAALLSLVAIYTITALVARSSASELLPTTVSEQSSGAVFVQYAKMPATAGFATRREPARTY